MDGKWREIWGERNASDRNNLDLKQLIDLDGFDSGAGRIEVDDWREYARRIVEKLSIANGDSVYEVGAGCGAFLFALRELLDIDVSGCDYSTGLIKTAQRVFPGRDFQCIDAAEIDPCVQKDFVISNAVFHYFDLNYAREVLVKMLHKTNVGGALCILEIPDIKTREQAENLRRTSLSIDEYEKKYAGLHHTYYERNWFVSVAAEHGLKCETFDGCIPNYAQNQYRFGVLIRKG
jgi:trans-aconitate methyltransferase